MLLKLIYFDKRRRAFEFYCFLNSDFRTNYAFDRRLCFIFVLIINFSIQTSVLDLALYAANKVKLIKDATIVNSFKSILLWTFHRVKTIRSLIKKLEPDYEDFLMSILGLLRRLRLSTYSLISGRPVIKWKGRNFTGKGQKINNLLNVLTHIFAEQAQSII